ncbi:MerR family transcriptional regulator [Streptomyces sp. NPDC055287]
MDVARQPSQDAGLTTGALALRLGVAPTTLRSWDRRYGLGPAAREGGRHRRWTPADVAVLERMCLLTARGVAPAEAARLARSRDAAQDGPFPPAVVPGPRTTGNASPGNAPPAGTAPGGTSPAYTAYTEDKADRALRADGADGADVTRVARGLSRAAVRLDSPRLDALLASAVAEYGLVRAWEDVMTTALRAIGRTWATGGDEAGERYVEAEHLLSWHISCALRHHRPTGGTESHDPPVLLACAPGEAHTLALEALAAALGERGTPVRMFGAAVPVGALSEAVRRTGPLSVVLWSQTRATADRALARLVRATARGIRGARTRPAVLVAGPGWTRTRPTEGVHRPNGLTHALELIGAGPGR